VGNAVFGEIGRRTVRKSGGERVSLSWLSRVNAQLVKSRSISRLRVAPTNAEHANRQTQQRGQFPLQHVPLSASVCVPVPACRRQSSATKITPPIANRLPQK